jgi:hypothetical protein
MDEFRVVNPLQFQLSEMLGKGIVELLIGSDGLVSLFSLRFSLRHRQFGALSLNSVKLLQSLVLKQSGIFQDGFLACIKDGKLGFLKFS